MYRGKQCMNEIPLRTAVSRYRRRSEQINSGVYDRLELKKKISLGILSFMLLAETSVEFPCVIN